MKALRERMGRYLKYVLRRANSWFTLQNLVHILPCLFWLFWVDDWFSAFQSSACSIFIEKSYARDWASYFNSSWTYKKCKIKWNGIECFLVYSFLIASYLQQNNLIKAREGKYLLRIRVLEELARGTHEENQVFSD